MFSSGIVCHPQKEVIQSAGHPLGISEAICHVMGLTTLANSAY